MLFFQCPDRKARDRERSIQGYGMSPKKTHEVANMSSYISHFLREIEGEMEVRHIVDVGAGQVCPFVLFSLFLCFLLIGNIKNSSLREGERILLNLVCGGRWGKFSVRWHLSCCRYPILPHRENERRKISFPFYQAFSTHTGMRSMTK